MSADWWPDFSKHWTILWRLSWITFSSKTRILKSRRRLYFNFSRTKEICASVSRDGEKPTRSQRLTKLWVTKKKQLSWKCSKEFWKAKLSLDLDRIREKVEARVWQLRFLGDTVEPTSNKFMGFLVFEDSRWGTSEWGYLCLETSYWKEEEELNEYGLYKCWKAWTLIYLFVWMGQN